jgi:hypothetical protein
VLRSQLRRGSSCIWYTCAPSMIRSDTSTPAGCDLRAFVSGSIGLTCATGEFVGQRVRPKCGDRPEASAGPTRQRATRSAAERLLNRFDDAPARRRALKSFPSKGCFL